MNVVISTSTVDYSAGKSLYGCVDSLLNGISEIEIALVINLSTDGILDASG